MYDFVIVGAGLYGCVLAHELHSAGKNVVVVEKRSTIGGNCYTEVVNGITVHKYGAHIFHTSNENIWNYVNQFVKFNPYVHQVKARYKDNIYSLPFNMHTFNEMWGCTTSDDAKTIIDKQRYKESPTNLEEYAKSIVGTDIYNKLIKGYTEKQWGKRCSDLPDDILKRIPLRFEYNNNYFNDEFQGIPENGYTELCEKLLDGIEIRYNCDFLIPYWRTFFTDNCKKIIYTGRIDEYYDFVFGELEYRSVCFFDIMCNTPSYQETAVVNYTDADVPYTRIIEHKKFDPNCKTNFTIISEEHPVDSGEPCYPIMNNTNIELYSRYSNLACGDSKVEFGGRLGEYKYYDMDKVIESALRKAKELCL